MTDKVYKYPPAIQKQVEEKRKILYEEEIAKGKKMRDSDLYRVDAMDISDDSCSLSLGRMKWSEQFILKHHKELWEQLDASEYPNGIAVSALIETNDGYFIFGERWDIYATRQTWDIAMIGGTLQPDETQVNSYQWFYDHIVQELTEETGIADQYIYNSMIVGIQRMQNGWIAFVYYFKLTIDSTEILKLFDLREDMEMSALKFVAKTEVIGFLKDLCFKDWILRRTMGLQIDYLEEIFRNT